MSVQYATSFTGPDSPVYVHDHRGLLVPLKSGEVSGTDEEGHVRTGSTPAVMQGSKPKQGAKFMSVCKLNFYILW